MGSKQLDPHSKNLRVKFKVSFYNMLTLFILGGFLIPVNRFTVRAASYYSPSKQVAPVNTDRIVHIKFHDGMIVDRPIDLLPPNLRPSVEKIEPLFNLPNKKLDQIKEGGEARLRKFEKGEAPFSNQQLPDLKLWFQLILKPNVDSSSMIDHLKQLALLEVVEPAPLPAPPPVNTPYFADLQGYLGLATDGVDAHYSWDITGGDGNGVTIYDIEYSWNQNHEDLSKANGVSLLLNSSDSAIDPFDSNHHGTAVLGEIIADNDTKGVTGISWGANIGLAPAYTSNLFYNPANAILLAVNDGSAGDVILIEQQYWVCGLDEYGPLEWILSVYDAIQTAVANGFVVVEAAGNGNVNLDQTACGTVFNRDIQDSGAIIVGAGQPPSSGSDRERESFSSYGNRVDVQGWGSAVMSTGYGTHYTNSSDPTNPNFWYTDSFGGTSSASPIIAGVVANLQGISLNTYGASLLPQQMRDLLIQTGSPQLGSTNENIGPRPNLRDAIDTFLINFTPVLDPIGEQIVDELTLLSFTAQANDPNVPPQSLTFTLDVAPAGAGIDSLTGDFTWTPTESQGPGIYPITIRVIDNGIPSHLDDFETFNITVNEVNQFPVLAPIGNKIMDEMAELAFTATATDSDIPTDMLTFSLDPGAPLGASIHPTTGFFTWTPIESQGPGDYPITIRVADNGIPSQLDDFETINITVNEVNQTPVLASIGNKIVNEMTELSFTATATDTDFPADTLTFSLDPGAPLGASIHPTTGLFTWTPTAAQSLAVYPITIRVTDDSTPTLSDFETISVSVMETTFLPLLIK